MFLGRSLTLNYSPAKRRIDKPQPAKTINHMGMVTKHFRMKPARITKRKVLWAMFTALLLMMGFYCNTLFIPMAHGKDIGEAAILRKGLFDPDPGVRLASVQGLQAMGDVAPKLMVSMLKDESEPVRDAAEKSLASMGPPAVTTLGELLLKEPVTSECFDRTLRALDAIAAEESIPFLTEAVIRNRGYGAKASLILKALLSSGKPSADEVSALLKYRDLRSLVPTALKEYDKSHGTRYYVDLMKAGVKFPFVVKVPIKKPDRQAKTKSRGITESQGWQESGDETNLINITNERWKEINEEYKECMREAHEEYIEEKKDLGLSPGLIGGPISWPGIGDREKKKRARRAESERKRRNREYAWDRKRIEDDYKRSKEYCAEQRGSP